MFEGAVAGVLNRLLGKYIQDLDTENLNVGIFSGNVSLTDLKLKPEALYELDLPIDVKIGTIGKIVLQIPWSGLYTHPVIVNIEDVLVLVGPAISNTHFDPEREKRLMRAAKRKILEDLESESEILKGPQNFFENLFTAIVNNLQIYVRNVHVRYEDSISSKDGPLACGLCLQSLSIETTNNKWKPSVPSAEASTVYQIMKVESLSLYWNPTATTLDDAEIANLTPIQYYNWKHYMLTGLDKFSMHHEEFEFLLKPVACKVKVLISRSGESKVPRLLLDAVIQDSAFYLSRRQYLSILNLLKSFERITLNRKYRHLHPGVPLSNNIKKWWIYAYNGVVEQRVRPYTWDAIKRHRDNYKQYKTTYKSTLCSPNDTELKLDLQKCEDNLPIISVVLAREEAKYELLRREPNRIEVVKTEDDWWRPSGSDGESDSDSDEPKKCIELCVKTEKSKSLWSHLSAAERKRVCELIGIAEAGTSKEDKSSQCIDESSEHKLNLTLSNCSITLMNRQKEIAVMTLSQFLATFETRPASNAFKLSTRTEGIVVEGLSPDNELMQILVVAQCPMLGGCTALAVDVEKNPMNSHADYGISCNMQPMELLYVEHAFTELINFFQTRSMTFEDLIDEVAMVLGHVGSLSKSLLTQAMKRKKIVQLSVDLKGPTILIPEFGNIQKNGRYLVIDVNRFSVKSDLQPPNVTLEDATCMELEEKLYDRYHAECTYQVIFADNKTAWLESRQYTDSEVHLVPSIKAQLVFSTSIKKDYRLLPRYKLNLSLSSVKLNLSDRVICNLVDFFENLPLPVPNTVPVSFMDSGDYVEETEDPELAEFLQVDRICSDPGYTHLLRLRHKVVAACFNRDRLIEPEKENIRSHSPVESLPGDFIDDEIEEYARSVDLPGFDDNVSPSNTINTLMRFVVGELVINLNRRVGATDQPYMALVIKKVCLDVALMEYGPAIQLGIAEALITDHQHHDFEGRTLELFTNKGELFNLLYRKVRADCPEFRSHFHSVEHSLVADVGQIMVLIHATSVSTFAKYLQYIENKAHLYPVINISNAVQTATAYLDSLMRSDNDPPVPSGATKFSYSLRLSAALLRLWAPDGPLMEARVLAVESDCMFRANDRVIFKLYLGAFSVDDTSEESLYPKITKVVWPDEDKVLEVKYVKTSSAEGERPAELRVFVGRLHVVLFCSLVYHLQQMLENLLPSGAPMEMVAAVDRWFARQWEALRSTPKRLNLVVEIHAPLMLLPQKPSSPNLLVLSLGELFIENFYKTVDTGDDPKNPGPSYVLDNILMKLANVSLSRAVMTLTGALEVQELILEPMSVKCDLKRTTSYVQMASSIRDLLLCEADITMEPVIINLGQKDLATILAVWSDNLSEGRYIGTFSPSTPVEVAASDATVKKLQAFFAQGDTVKKESIVRFCLEGIEMRLFSDIDEILSSPVRDMNHALLKMSVGEAAFTYDYFSDGSIEIRTSLQSLLIRDIRPDSSIVIRKILESQGGGRVYEGCVSVERPALLEAVLHRTARATRLDMCLERTRLNLSPSFVLQFARAILDTLPGDRTLDGGVVNHGYDNDLPPRSFRRRFSRFPSTSESTSGYYSAATSVSEDLPSLAVSIQCRQPEIMVFSDLSKPEGQALILRTELLIDYSTHSNTSNLVISLAGLQMMSRLQSKLKNLPPEYVLKPSDVEFSKTFNNAEEGVIVKLSVSEIDVRVAPTMVHTIMDIIDEIKTEVALPDERELFNYATYTPQKEKPVEELWSPKKMDSYLDYNIDEAYGQANYSCGRTPEKFLMSIPKARIMFELEQSARVPVLFFKFTAEAKLQDWSRNLHGNASLTLEASTYNDKLDVWEPLIEPVVEDNVQKPWEIIANIFQEKAQPIVSAKTKHQPPRSGGDSMDPAKKTKKKRFESETSADEADTDNEMIFIRNPLGGKTKGCKVDLSACNVTLLRVLGTEESDSEQEERPKQKLSTIIGNLFTDSDSSLDEYSDGEDSSGPEESGAETSEREDDKPLSYADDKKKEEIKSVTVKEPTHDDSVEMCDETRWSTCVMLESRDPLNVTMSVGGARVLQTLSQLLSNRTAAVSALVTQVPTLQLINDLGPRSTVVLRNRANPDLQDNDYIVAIADFDDSSRPSTPGGDTSTDDYLGEVEKDILQEIAEMSDEWDNFEGGFPAGAIPISTKYLPPDAQMSAQELLHQITSHTLTIRVQDFEHLTIMCPQRSVSKLHVLQPCKQGIRYYVVIDRTCQFNIKKVVVRSPLQVRNETSYALEVLYRKSELEVTGTELVGELRNPFGGLLRLAIVSPHETFNVPLYVAYHCRLYLVPANFDYQATCEGVWWMDLVNHMGTPRDYVCASMRDRDDSVFAMKVMAAEGCQSPRVSGMFPNLVLRVLPPLAVHNRLPHAIQVTGRHVNMRIEAGERACVYTLRPGQSHRLKLEINYLGLPWSGSFTLLPDMIEKTVSMITDTEVDGGSKGLIVRARLRQGAEMGLLLYAPCWVINKTGLPLQIKGRSESCYSVTEEALLWGERGVGGASGTSGERMRVRAQQSGWSRPTRLPAHAPGLIICAHPERRQNYRILLQVTLSELCPQLTKIVTLLPYFVIFNDTKRHLRFMEENEAADLWIDLAPQQSTPFWPQTDSMAMHCKYRDSSVVSQHFAIATKHFTVLRMDKGTAICVDVAGGNDRPFVITFKPYTNGDAPVRFENLCDDLYVKLHQAESGQVALLSPYQSMLYTWDDPLKEREVWWNIYNNKGKGNIADFSQDGFGEIKVSFHSIKNSTLVQTNSVTSKLSSTLKRLTPKSPDPCSSSSDDSDTGDIPEILIKGKKMRKDKAIVYWISFMDGNQRVYALSQDEKIAHIYKSRIDSEKSVYDVYVALANIGLSVCVPTRHGVKELSYVSIIDSIPKWHININNKWRQFAPDINAWVEEKYQSDQRICKLSEMLHIDLEKMYMTKPFYTELKRVYNPGLWLHLRRSETYTYYHFKMNALQIDNQLHDAVFPNVLYPAPLPANLKCKEKPSLELVALKQHRPSLNQDLYKHFKFILQEYCINLDRGFVNHVFDILNNWKIDEKPAVRLRSDLALVHMPLSVLASKAQTSSQRDVVFEYAHISPIKLVLALSSRGCSTDDVNSPMSYQRLYQRENRPKIFNSDLLEFLFNSWGSSLCDMKDVVFRLGYFELRNRAITFPALVDSASQHYWLQLVQQFYVMVLGMNILGNPYSTIGDFTKGLKDYYEPYLASASGSSSMAVSMMHNASQMLQCFSSRMIDMQRIRRMRRSAHGEEVPFENLPMALLDSYRSNPASVVLALSGLIARSSFDEDNCILKYVSREAARISNARGECSTGVGGAETALRMCVERTRGGLLARRRLPRSCSHIQGVSPYSPIGARGEALLALLARGHYADMASYLGHAHLSRTSHSTVLLTTQHIILVRTGGCQGGWRLEWVVRLDELIGTPYIRDGKMILNIKQDEKVNYFSNDEKVIEAQQPEVLLWLQAKIVCALVQALEDQRCTGTDI